jgi:hypothetical protein
MIKKYILIELEYNVLYSPKRAKIKPNTVRVKMSNRAKSLINSEKQKHLSRHGFVYSDYLEVGKSGFIVEADKVGLLIKSTADYDMIISSVLKNPKVNKHLRAIKLSTL